MKKILRKSIVGSLIAGATVLGGLGIFYSQRADASNGVGGAEKHVLIASIGYMGGSQVALCGGDLTKKSQIL